MHHATLSPDTVAASFGPEMLNDAACRRWMITATRGQDLSCPYCAERLDAVRQARLYAGKNIKCRACGRTGTVLEGSSLSDRQMMLALALMKFELPVSSIAGMTGCSRQAVYDWMQRLGVKPQ